MVRRKQLRESGPAVARGSIGLPGQVRLGSVTIVDVVTLPGGFGPRPVPPSPAPDRPLRGRINGPNGLRSRLPGACPLTRGDAWMPVVQGGKCGVSRRSGRL